MRAKLEPFEVLPKMPSDKVRALQQQVCVGPHTRDPGKAERMTNGETESITQVSGAASGETPQESVENPRTCMRYKDPVQTSACSGGGTQDVFSERNACSWLTASLKNEYEFVRQESSGLAEHWRKSEEHMQGQGSFRG